MEVKPHEIDAFAQDAVFASNLYVKRSVVENYKVDVERNEVVFRHSAKRVNGRAYQGKRIAGCAIDAIELAIIQNYRDGFLRDVVQCINKGVGRQDYDY